MKVSCRFFVQVEAGSTVAVWGVGCVGLAVIMGCKEVKAKRIIAVDINPAKETAGQIACPPGQLALSGFVVMFVCLAKEFGATDFINPKTIDKPIQQHLVELTGGLDFTFECVGNVQTMVSGRCNDSFLTLTDGTNWWS